MPLYIAKGMCERIKKYGMCHIDHHYIFSAQDDREARKKFEEEKLYRLRYSDEHNSSLVKLFKITEL